MWKLFGFRYISKHEANVVVGLMELRLCILNAADNILLRVRNFDTTPDDLYGVVFNEEVPIQPSTKAIIKDTLRVLRSCKLIESNEDIIRISDEGIILFTILPKKYKRKPYSYFSKCKVEADRSLVVRNQRDIWWAVIAISGFLAGKLFDTLAGWSQALLKVYCLRHHI